MKSIKVTKDNIVALFESKIDPDHAFATISVCADVEELRKVRRQITALEKQKDELAKKIKQIMGEKDCLVGADGTVIATNKMSEGAMGIDSELLKEFYPEAYKDCLVKGKGYRSLLLK